MKFTKLAMLILIAGMLIGAGCTIIPHKDYNPEPTIADVIAAKQNTTFQGCEPLPSLGSFGSYFTNHYNSKQYITERFVQFEYVNPATTRFLWQKNAKARAYMLAEYGYTIP